MHSSCMPNIQATCCPPLDISICKVESILPMEEEAPLDHVGLSAAHLETDRCVKPIRSGSNTSPSIPKADHIVLSAELQQNHDLKTESLVVLPPLKPGKVDAQEHKPKHYEMERLEIGNFVVESQAKLNGKSTNKFKVIFSKRQFVYEFEVENQPNSSSASNGHQKTLACIVVPFQTAVGLKCEGSLVKLLLDTQPAMYLGLRHARVGIIASVNVYDMAKCVDITDGAIKSCRLHQVTLGKYQADKLKVYLWHFDARFRVLTQIPLYDPGTPPLPSQPSCAREAVRKQTSSKKKTKSGPRTRSYRERRPDAQRSCLNPSIASEESRTRPRVTSNDMYLPGGIRRDRRARTAVSSNLEKDTFNKGSNINTPKQALVTSENSTVMTCVKGLFSKPNNCEGAIESSGVSGCALSEKRQPRTFDSAFCPTHISKNKGDPFDAAESDIKPLIMPLPKEASNLPEMPELGRKQAKETTAIRDFAIDGWSPTVPPPEAYSVLLPSNSWNQTAEYCSVTRQGQSFDNLLPDQFLDNSRALRSRGVCIPSQVKPTESGTLCSLEIKQEKNAFCLLQEEEKSNIIFSRDEMREHNSLMVEEQESDAFCSIGIKKENDSFCWPKVKQESDAVCSMGGKYESDTLSSVESNQNSNLCSRGVKHRTDADSLSSVPAQQGSDAFCVSVIKREVLSDEECQPSWPNEGESDYFSAADSTSLKTAFEDRIAKTSLGHHGYAFKEAERNADNNISGVGVTFEYDGSLHCVVKTEKNMDGSDESPRDFNADDGTECADLVCGFRSGMGVSSQYDNFHHRAVKREIDGSSESLRDCNANNNIDCADVGCSFHGGISVSSQYNDIHHYVVKTDGNSENLRNCNTDDGTEPADLVCSFQMSLEKTPLRCRAKRSLSKPRRRKRGRRRLNSGKGHLMCKTSSVVKQSQPDEEACITDASRIPNRPGMRFEVGAYLEAKDYLDKWYLSKIIDVNWDNAEVLIHFIGWSHRFDEWIPMDSLHLRPLTYPVSHSNGKAKLKEWRMRRDEGNQSCHDSCQRNNLPFPNTPVNSFSCTKSYFQRAFETWTRTCDTEIPEND